VENVFDDCASCARCIGGHEDGVDGALDAFKLCGSELLMVRHRVYLAAGLRDVRQDGEDVWEILTLQINNDDAGCV